jgi:hypothetical protein
MINPQKGIDLMNNTSIINRILFAVTIFQQAIEVACMLVLPLWSDGAALDVLMVSPLCFCCAAL